MVGSVSAVYPRVGGAVWEHHERIVPHIAGPGKDQNSKPKVRFLLNAYHFGTIVKLKNCIKLNHCKLGDHL